MYLIASPLLRWYMLDQFNIFLRKSADHVFVKHNPDKKKNDSTNEKTVYYIARIKGVQTYKPYSKQHQRSKYQINSHNGSFSYRTIRRKIKLDCRKLSI